MDEREYEHEKSRKPITATNHLNGSMKKFSIFPRLLLSILLLVCGACASPATQIVSESTATPTSTMQATSPATPTLLMKSTAMFPILPTPSLTAVSFPLPTQTLVFIPSATATEMLLPTATGTPAASPTVTPTFSPVRRTPATLMLHPSSDVFDSVAFLQAFVQILQENGIEVITYQTISEHPEITAVEQGRLVIITIDDISLQAPLDDSVQGMIAILLEADYPAVLGVVTEGQAADDETAQTLRDLSAQGWEIAAHTDTHQNLGELEALSPGDMRAEIRTCGDKLFEAVGVRPITLVLPYGQMVQNAKLIYKEHIIWAVGINGGVTYNSAGLLYYVGREGPDGDADLTFRIMMQRFNP